MSVSDNIILFSFSAYNFSDTAKLRTMAYHSHNSLELSYVTEGELLFEYYDKNGNYESFYLHKNQFAIVKPYVTHKTSVTIGLQSYGVEFVGKTDIVRYIKESNFVNGFGKAAKKLLDKDDDIVVLQDTENVFNTLLQLKNYTKNTPYSDVLFELDIKKLFVQILLCSEKVGTGNTYNLYVNKALRYIKQNFNRDISTDDVAAYLGISAVYFQKIFHSATGEKFNRYLNKQRINYAVNLLQNTNYSLKKIASMVGYNSLQNFIGNFKRIMQTSPSEYKNGVFDGFQSGNDSYINEIYRETVFKPQ